MAIRKGNKNYYFKQKDSSLKLNSDGFSYYSRFLLCNLIEKWRRIVSRTERDKCGIFYLFSYPQNKLIQRVLSAEAPTVYPPHRQLLWNNRARTIGRRCRRCRRHGYHRADNFRAATTAEKVEILARYNEEAEEADDRHSSFLFLRVVYPSTTTNFFSKVLFLHAVRFWQRKKAFQVSQVSSGQQSEVFLLLLSQSCIW